MLSEREIAILDEALTEISAIKGSTIADWTHKHFPELQDPHGSSVPIPPKHILRYERKTEDEIASLKEELAHFQFARTALS